MGKSIRKFEKICVSVGILLFVLSGCSRQKEFVYTTSVIFPSSASLDEKVKMAAHVVPSSRQLEWQKMEQTCFICYGINTFTDREWGTGDEDLSLFNPTALDAGQWVRTAKQAGMKMVAILQTVFKRQILFRLETFPLIFRKIREQNPFFRPNFVLDRKE